MLLTSLRHLFVPHHSNNHRAKILQPIGLAMLIGIFLLLETWTKLLAFTPLPQGMVLGYASNINAADVISQTNAERAKAGVGPLKHNSLLSEAAQAKAQNMFQLNYWAHIAPDGTTPWFFIKQAGYQYSVAGENLARDFGDTVSMVQAWMNSPTHRENMVNPKYEEIGVAVVNGKLEGMETTLVVQMFGKPTNSVAQTGDKAATTQRAVAAVIPTAPPATPEPTQVPEPMSLPLSSGVTLASNESGNTSGWLISPLMLTKAIAVSIMLMLVCLWMYDEYLIGKHKIPRRVGKNWAHLTLFGIVLMMVVTLVPGKIL